MNFASIFFGVLFFGAGILFACGKIHPHLSTWKNMSQEEQKKIRIEPLCRNIGRVIAASGALFLAKGFWNGLSGRWFTVVMVVWLIAAGFDVWYIGKSGRYVRK